MSEELERLTMGATVRTIGMPDVRRLVTPIPPVLEQRQIIENVHWHRSQLDNLLAKVREAIGRLKELRAAVIAAAVTGKIDVRAA
jgi:type I restriction enzyme S subunit